MAAEVQYEKPHEDAMKNLKMDIPSSGGKISEFSSKVGNHPHIPTFTPSQGVVATGANGDFGQEYFVPGMGYYPMNGYYGYYYPGYDGPFGGWDEQVNGLQGFDIQYPVVQGDNTRPFHYNSPYHLGYDAYGSHMPGTTVGVDGQYVAHQPGFPGTVLQQPLSPHLGYDAYGSHMPGTTVGVDGQYVAHQPGFPGTVLQQPLSPHLGYDAYGSHMPGTTVGVDGQYVAHQPGFLGTVLQQPLSPQVFSPSQISYRTDIVPPFIWEGSPLPADATNGNRLGGGLTLPVPKLKPPPSMHAAAAVKAAAYTKFIDYVDKENKKLVDAPSNQPIKSEDKVAQRMSTLPASAALAKVYIPIAKLPVKAGLLFSGATINAKGSGQGWNGPGRLKGRIIVNGLSSFSRLNEQNCGPRNTRQRTPTLNGDSTELEDISKITSFRKDQYNLPNFQTKYDHALFFVIKSYTEDNVHMSIKYDVWASTPNGNKKLDDAYEGAQKKAVVKGSKCPVFLFFSVNASGQFCGVAEMTNRVDFHKNMDFWQQDKWNGFFPVKWHVIKDVPHTQFRHIRLENNDNKPVSNSRDTQEVYCLQGIEMLDIFKNYSAKTSIIDDFGYYESKQKIMLDKKI